MSTKQGKYKLASTKRWMEKETGNFTGSFLKTPPKASLYKVKVGKAKLDIIPYVAGAGNPNADEGMLWWERTFFVHRNIGPNQAVVICPARTMEQPCPVCEARQRLLKQDEPEEADGLKPKEWVIVQLRDRNDKEKGIQLLPFSFHRFVDKVHEMANSGDAEEKYDEFWHPKGGKLLRVNWGEDSAGDRGGKYVRAKTVIFEDRPDLNDATIDQGYCLDELLIVMEYKKLKALFETGEGAAEDEESEEEDDEKPKKKKKGADEDESEEESDDSESEEEEEDEKPKKKKKPSDEDEEEESEEEDESEEEEKPKKKKKPSDEDEESEEEEEAESEDEDEEEKPKKKKKASEDEESEEEEAEEEPEEEDEKPKKKKKPSDEDEDESEEEESEEEETPSKKGKAKPSAKKNKGEPEDEEGEGWDGFDSPDSEEGEEEDEEEKPKKKKK